jgi:hypothetical protein
LIRYRRTNKGVRQGAKQSGQICTHHKKLELGDTEVAKKVITNMCSVQSVLWGLRVEAYRCQTKSPHYLSRVDHERKIRSRKQRTDIGKYAFLNRTIQIWNQLPAEVFENLPCKQNIFKRRVGKAIIECN